MSRCLCAYSKLSLLSLCVGALIALGLPFRQANAQASLRPSLIVDRIDETRVVTLAGNTRPEANPANDRGRVPDDFPLNHMLLQLKRSAELEHALTHFMDEQLDKQSPNFRHWLMPAELGEKYGVADSDIETITSWLESHGFTVGYVYPTKILMDISGTARQIREAFHTEIHYLDVNGEQHYANMSDPRIPVALAPAVVGIVQMHNFKPHSMARPRIPSYNLGGGDYALVPADYQTIYNLTPLYRVGIYGQGQTIVLVEDTNSYGTDWNTYQTTFGLNKYGGTFTTVHPNSAGNCTNPGTNGDDGEADIDVEVAAAIAPGATIELASCADGVVNATFGGLLAVENLVSAGSPPAIISMSYGECEAANGAAGNAAFSSAFQSAAVAGVSVFVSSGDESATSCSANKTSSTTGIGVTGWGESVYNVSVGGTDFEDTYNAAKPANDGLSQSTYWSSSNGSTYGDALSYIPEIPWNDSCASYLVYNLAGYATAYGSSGYCASLATGNSELTTGSGSGGPSGCATGSPSATNIVSGTCAGYAKPSWQSGILGNPADGVRDIPDVSMFASNGIWGHYVVVCWSDPAYTSSGSAPCTGAPSSWSGFGGTSISSPTMASIQALVDQKWNIRAGLPTPTYYAIANAEFGASGNPACYSINQQQPRRGEQSSCTFYDITQGDIVVNTSGTHVNSYLPSGTTRGSLSTQALTSATVIAGGVGYTSNPTCAFAAPSNLNQYLSPQNTVLYAGGTQATCTATFNAGTLTEVGTITLGTVATTWAGATITVGSTTYTLVNGAPTAVNQIQLYTASTSTTNRTDTALDIKAVINGAVAQCPAVTPTCVFTGQTANASATASGTGSPVTVTANTVGATGNFALSVNNNQASNISTAYTTIGAGPGYVNAITLVNAGQGYAPGAGCTISGGGGSGAICVGVEAATTLAPTYQPAYGATPGWDFATGIGSPNAYNLVMNKAW